MTKKLVSSPGIFFLMALFVFKISLDNLLSWLLYHLFVSVSPPPNCLVWRRYQSAVLFYMNTLIAWFFAWPPVWLSLSIWKHCYVFFTFFFFHLIQLLPPFLKGCLTIYCSLKYQARKSTSWLLLIP